MGDPSLILTVAGKWVFVESLEERWVTGGRVAGMQGVLTVWATLEATRGATQAVQLQTWECCSCNPSFSALCPLTTYSRALVPLLPTIASHHCFPPLPSLPRNSPIRSDGQPMRRPLGLQAGWSVAKACTTPYLGPVDDDRIEFGELIGSGSFGRVYQAK